MKVVSDASPLIALARIGHFDLLPFLADLRQAYIRLLAEKIRVNLQTLQDAW